MNRLKNRLILVAVFALLATIGSIMNLHQAAAQGPANGLAVSIVNPLPVPVTGSTTISGPVAATQSGPWNVGITGQPVSIKNVDEPARNGFIATLTPESGSIGGSSADIQVPSTQRWVIESFSGSCDIPVTASLTDLDIETGAATVASTTPHFVQSDGGINGQQVNFWTGSAVTHLYFGPNARIIMRADTSAEGIDIVSCRNFVVSGYAVNLP